MNNTPSTMTRPSRRRRSARLTPRALDRLIDRLAAGEDAPGTIATDMRLSLRQLAQLTSAPETLRVLEQLARLSDLRTQMIVNRYRANAAVHLANLVATEDNSEIARKACVDLLKADVAPFGARQTDALVVEEASAPAEPSIDAIRDALEALGVSALEDDHDR